MSDEISPERKVPRLTSTLILAGALLLFDGFVSGQGILSLFVLIFGTPILLLRVFLARRNPALRKRRLLSIPIYMAAAALAIVLVRGQREATRQKAESIIAACEKFKAAKGVYPEKLAELVPGFLAAIPTTKHGGFNYFRGNPPATRRIQRAKTCMLLFTRRSRLTGGLILFWRKRSGDFTTERNPVASCGVGLFRGGDGHRHWRSGSS
jgi:hypothetical protein